MQAESREEALAAFEKSVKPDDARRKWRAARIEGQRLEEWLRHKLTPPETSSPDSTPDGTPSQAKTAPETASDWAATRDTLAAVLTLLAKKASTD